MGAMSNSAVLTDVINGTSWGGSDDGSHCYDCSSVNANTLQGNNGRAFIPTSGHAYRGDYYVTLTAPSGYI
jgi:hypothetical protein